jgi:hypothetical protein
MNKGKINLFSKNPAAKKICNFTGDFFCLIVFFVSAGVTMGISS